MRYSNFGKHLTKSSLRRAYSSGGTVGKPSPSGELLVENASNVRIITLNRPKVLNALSLTQVRELTQMIKAYHDNKMVKAVVLKGEGGRAFCAGGDIRSLYDNGREDSTRHLTQEFFAEEYNLNQLLKFSHVPIISMLNGITMGGGVGLSVHGEFRVATENTMFAMPETGIGFFPDVGGSYFLPRCRMRGIGNFLGLTGERLKGADCVHAGVATHYIGNRDIDAVISRVQDVVGTSMSERNFAEDYVRIEEMLSEEFHTNKTDTPFYRNMKSISDAFVPKKVTMESIIHKLRDAERRLKETPDEDQWATRALKSIHRASPTALKVTLKLLQNGHKITRRSGPEAEATMMNRCMVREHYVAQAFMESHDFFEGVRAVVVDKDQSPSWSPAKLEDVQDGFVDSFFQKKGKVPLPLFADPIASDESEDGTLVPTQMASDYVKFGGEIAAIRKRNSREDY